MKDGIKIIGMEETMAVLDQIREDFKGDKTKCDKLSYSA